MDAVFFGRVVAGSFMIRTTIISDYNVTLLPLMVILGAALDHMVGELIDQHIAFLFAEPLDPQNFARIEVQCLAAGL